MAQDRQGNPITGSAASAAALDAVIWDYYAWTGDILGTLGAAVRDDPGFVLGHTATATILLLGGFRSDHPAVMDALATADAVVAKATAREQAHMAVAKTVTAGQLRDAARLCEHILASHPVDALVLRYATDLYYYLGDANGIRDVVARALPAWRETDPIYGFILGRHAFGLEESGELDRAYEVARRALTINPRDVWATHATAHVHEMRGQPDEGIHFLESTHKDWQAGKWLAVHNGWHLALFLIDAGRGDEVLAKYDVFVQPRLKDNFILDLIDAASLLWRLELTGADVGARWTEVAGIAAARIGEHVLAFNDLHVMLGLAGGKDRAAMAKLLASVDRYLADAKGDNRVVTADVGRALVIGMEAFGGGDDRRAIEALLPVREAVERIGGSQAQRDVVDETLIAAALRAEDWVVARTVLAARMKGRPTPRTLRLRDQVEARFASILQKTGQRA
ncbi:MAG TPA: tetratricopeptide repeat protein [Magnetospirillaceae bacterium]|jgi:tetratricopeptide (TPR) repeat protein